MNDQQQQRLQRRQISGAAAAEERREERSQQAPDATSSTAVRSRAAPEQVHLRTTRAHLAAHLRTPAALRQALLLHEILSPPAALRAEGPHDDPPRR